jgi:hypothetical protein
MSVVVEKDKRNGETVRLEMENEIGSPEILKKY